MISRTGRIHERPAPFAVGIRRLLLGVVIGALVAAAGLARPVGGPEVASASVEEPEFRIAQRGGVSLQEAVRIATSRYQGRVVRATTTERGGRRVHEIRILVPGDNRVVTVRIDAQTGEMR